MNLSQLTKLNEEQAREYLEKIRWPEGPYCPRCGCMEVTKLQGKSTRPGVYKCKGKGCRKPFTVTVGTIFERSHVKLREWLIAFHMMCSSKKGVSAHQIHRSFGVTYKTAWFICHRIRHALNVGSFDAKLSGVVEADETFVGGKPRANERRKRKGPNPNKPKAPVVALVQRDGSVRAVAMPRVTAASLRDFIQKDVDKSATLMTDENRLYKKLGRTYARHGVIKHVAQKYVQGDVTTNAVEGFFALLKRGVYGAFHHESPKHLQRYVDEFRFRYNHRKSTDGQRRDAALAMAEGKRLTYR